MADRVSRQMTIHGPKLVSVFSDQYIHLGRKFKVQEIGGGTFNWGKAVECRRHSFPGQPRYRVYLELDQELEPEPPKTGDV